MAHLISKECIKCGTCEAECPVKAIKEDTDQFVIDPDVCIDCASCAGVCPVGAISEA